MYRYLLFATTFLVLHSCAPVQINEYQEIRGATSLFAQARDVVTRTLKDPESARFRNEYAVRTTLERNGVQLTADVVCGQLNARNSFGGYTGFDTYAVAFRDGKVVQVGANGTPLADCRRLGYPY